MWHASKLKVHKASSTRKSGGAPVSHWLPVSPEPQRQTKLPTVFMHEPPFWQAALYGGIVQISSETRNIVTFFPTTLASSWPFRHDISVAASYDVNSAPVTFPKCAPRFECRVQGRRRSGLCVSCTVRPCFQCTCGQQNAGSKFWIVCRTQDLYRHQAS